MRKRIFLIISLFIFTAFFIFEFAPTSSAQNQRKQTINSVKTFSVVRESRFKFAPFAWQTIVNNSFSVPGSAITFSSYGQPSVNTQGVIVFRGRSTGSSDRESGIYMRQNLGLPIQDFADLDFDVPYPNNLNTKFIEFPSIPRISQNQINIATRGNHQPVYRYLLPDGTETRVGTTGLYAQLNSDLLITGASKLGVVPGFEYFVVPNTDPPVPFSVFPGSPAINDQGSIVFKGNYSVNNVEKTGIFFRQLLNTPGGGIDPVEVIASSDTDIPNAPPSFRALTFDSTAPPSVSGNEVVFVGLDYEDDPHYGGIYLAPLKPNPPLKTLVGIGETLPGLNDGPEITRIGEGLSFDGHYLAFWAAWGNETKTLRLNCPVDGNADILAYCNGVDPNSIFDPKTQTWYQLKQVHINQGIFVLDVIGNRTFLVANSTTDFNDFLFWTYSGKAPRTGGGDEDAEPPRWRQSAFMSVYDGLIAFKARTGKLNNQNEYVDPVDGIYLSNILMGGNLETLIETGMDGSIFDTMLQPNEMTIVGLGIEREGLRGHNLAITATMANAEESWGGIYLANVMPNQLNDAPIKIIRGRNTKANR